MTFVYLAGPITGLSYEDATQWRFEAEVMLTNRLGIQTRSPLRDKPYLKDEESLAFSYSNHTLSTPRAIMTRDYNDVKGSSVVLANFLNSKTISSGTAMELAWAYHLHIPVVAIVEKNNIHAQHPMISECFNFVTDDLYEGFGIVATILGK